MIAPRVVAVLLVAAASSVALAEPRIAYVDEVAVFGGADDVRARALVDATLSRAGFTARYSDTAPPCGDDPACLVQHTRASGGSIGLRVTMAEIGGELVASVLVVDVARSDTRREIVDDPERPDGRFATALHLPPAEARRSRARFYRTWWFWTAVGGAAAIAIGGTARYLSGTTTVVAPPSGTIGGLDRR